MFNSFTLITFIYVNQCTIFYKNKKCIQYELRNILHKIK